MLQSLAGLIAFIAFAWLLSEDRRNARLPRVVVTGIGLQLLLGWVLLKLPLAQRPFMALNQVVEAVQEATGAGTSFVFGYVGGGPAPFDVTNPAGTFVFAFQGLPLILLVSALSALFFYWKVLPAVVRGFSWALQRTMGIGGAEGVGVAANIFVGMVEAPLLVRPYLKDMTRSEIFTLMTVGMATIAGTVMVLYASILGPIVPNALGHILVASIISAPAAIVISKLMVPESRPVTSGRVVPPVQAHSTMDAITQGTIQGVELLINIIAMIIVLIGLVQLVNIGLRLLPHWGGHPVTLQGLLGYVMYPVVWLIGVPAREALAAGSLMGTKTVLNELIAYVDMSHLASGTLSARTEIIMTYALCGFANPGSLGIMIGGMGAMAPERRQEIISLGFRSIVAGTLAACMTGAVAGLFV